MSRGFTLLEVLVALAIVALAVVTMVQLSAHGLRLLRTSEDYQEAVRLADRLIRAVEPDRERVDMGQQGALRWERRIALMRVPDELTSGAGPKPRLYTVSVAVAWGSNRTLELTSLHAAVETSDGAATESALR